MTVHFYFLPFSKGGDQDGDPYRGWQGIYSLDCMQTLLVRKEKTSNGEEKESGDGKTKR